MKVSVIITNYNYEQYVCDAVQSVLAQTLAPYEIIVIDDGSTDGSIEKLKKAFKESPLVKIYSQDNQGQMAAFNYGYQLVDGDIVFFLDGDDLYDARHLENVCNVYKNDESIDFISTGYQYAGSKLGEVLISKCSRSLGFSIIAAYFNKHWTGATSVISIRKELADKIFPYPEEWYHHSKAHADIGVVLGASLLGAKKYYLAEPTVFYRKHNDNHGLGKKHGKSLDYNTRVLTHKTIKSYWSKAKLPDSFILNALAEFKTIEHPTWDEFKVYRKIIMQTSQSLAKRLEQVFSAWKYYLKG